MDLGSLTLENILTSQTRVGFEVRCIESSHTLSVDGRDLLVSIRGAYAPLLLRAGLAPDYPVGLYRLPEF
jgi:hypothetical protein